MSRTIPRAYVTAAWSKNRVDAEDQARKYCSELVKAGYLPLCPVLAEMERTGCLVDRAALSRFGEMLSGRIAELEQNVYSLAGRISTSTPQNNWAKSSLKS